MTEATIDQVPRQLPGWQIEPFSDMSAAFLFSSAPARVCVLDRLSWWIYELADGRTETQIAEHVSATAPDKFGEGKGALPFVRSRLSSLRESGLLA